MPSTSFGAPCSRLPFGGLLFATALALGSSGPAQVSQPELADMIRRLSDVSTRPAAHRALVEAGQAAADELIFTLATGPDAAWATEMLRIVGELGPRAARVLPGLERLFPQLPVEVWPSALEAVGRIAPRSGDRQMVRRLYPILRDSKENLPPQLIEPVFLAWMRADQRMVGPQGGSIHTLISRIESRWGPELGLVMEELGGRGPAASEALGALKEYLKRGLVQVPVVLRSIDDVQVQFPFRDDGMLSAAEAMVKIDPDHPDTLVAHAVFLRHPDAQVRHRSLAAFAQASGTSSAETVPFLKQSLFDYPMEVIADTCTALGMLGPEAKGAIIALEQLSENENRQIAAPAEAAPRQMRR